MTTGDSLRKASEPGDPDATLMLQVRDDVPGAFEVLVERTRNRLHGLLANLIDSADEAESLTREVLLSVYRTRKGYRPQTRLSTWIFGLAYNQASSHLRSKARTPSSGSVGERHPRPPIEPHGAARGGVGPSPQRPDELSEAVRAALRTLDDDQRMAVLLSKFESMRYAEIAVVMRRSEEAVRSLLARARMDLRGQLEPYLRTRRRGV